MRHLDDGQIAEFLDDVPGHGETEGQRQEIEVHLAACAECRSLLERERHIRERAAAILAGSGPAETGAPPFEEVLHRAGQSAYGGPRTRPFRIVALAATVAIAAGVGWYGRGFLAEPRLQRATEPTVLTRDSLMPERAVVAASEATESEDVAAIADAAPPLPAAPPASPAARSQVAAQATEEAAAGGVAGVDATGRRGAPALQVAAARPPVELRQEALQPAAEPEPAMLEADRADPADREADETSWRLVDRREAERLLGGSIARVEGLVTLGHAVRLEAGGYVVRTRQRLGDVELELIQRRAVAPKGAAQARARIAVDAVAREIVDDERTEGEVNQTVRRLGFVITGRAPIPLDSLRALLARLRSQ